MRYRQEVMDAENPREQIFEVIDETVPKKVAEYLGDTEGAERDEPRPSQLGQHHLPPRSLRRQGRVSTRATSPRMAPISSRSSRTLTTKRPPWSTPRRSRALERYIILNAVDRLWQEHLYAMDGLREAVYLRAFAQKDPLVEYKNEAFIMFADLMDSIKLEVLSNLFRSTTNLQAFENLLRSLPQNLLQADFPGGAPQVQTQPQALRLVSPKRLRKLRASSCP